MKKIFSLLVLTLVFVSCQKEKVDLIVFNANVYTVDTNFNKAEAFAVKDGKFVAVGSTSDITNKYTTETTVDAEGQTLVPGLIDAHCHFFRFGLQQQKVSLEGTKSYDEVLQKISDFIDEKKVDYVTGRGWDQNDWDVKEFPTKKKLDKLFPRTPVAVRRVDGHALLVNEAALNYSGLSETNFPKDVTGGEFITDKNGRLTGVLIDRAMGYIKMPNTSTKEAIAGLMDAQKINFSYGLTTVDDAGLARKEIELMDSLQKTGDLKMRVYAMVSATQEFLDYYTQKGIYKTDRMNVRSFKVYGDGALGSRGAAMKKSYSDRDNHFGALIFAPERYEEIAKQIAASDYQMNTHAIGDSANYWVLNVYKEALGENAKDRRWRNEHSQIVDMNDFELFKNVIPSIQPTHATSDMYWAGDRVGSDRIKGGYAYKKLLDTYGMVALGTDYPVEQVNPFLTFYAAVVRQDSSGYPEGGYQMENALSREETLKGMTIWAAYSNFEENEKGSIEVGKFADFVILNQNIMEVEGSKIPDTKAVTTYLNGEKVY